MRTPRFAGLGAIGLLALLVIAGLPGPLGTSYGSMHPTSGGPARSGAASAGSSMDAPAASAPPCASNTAHFDSFGILMAPPTVAPDHQTPCAVGVDESALGFLSNSSGSGSRFQVSIALPPAGTAIASVLASWSFSFWASGVPCSLDQATQVQVQLIPPMGPYLGVPNLNWSVRAPAYDLVPAGACDPTCTNASALVTLDGASYCEDQVVVPKSGGPPVAPAGSFGPGDALTLTVVGTPAGPDPLAVYLNDSTHSTASLHFDYAAADLLTGKALTPRYDASRAADPVWGLSPGISAVARNCPAADLPAATCLSYNAPASAGTTPVQVVSVLSWNATSGTYSLPYPMFAAASSTQGCQSATLPCTSFGTAGGGYYPSWAMFGGGGSPWFAYGGPSSGLARTLAPSLDGAGAPTAQTLTALSELSVTSGPTFSLKVRATDPSGIVAVNASIEDCTSSSTATLSYTSMTLQGGAANTTFDGVWAGTLPALFTGTFPLWLTAESTAGTWSPLLTGSATWGPSGSCTVVAPGIPIVQTSDMTPTAGGLVVHWNDSDPIALGFVVNLTASSGPNASFTVGRESSLRADMGAYGVPFAVTVAALNANDVASAPSPAVTAPLTLGPFALVYTESSTTGLWVGSASVSFQVNATGGVGPFNASALYGDGIVDTNSSTNGSFAFSHYFGPYFGEALAFLVVDDAVGDQATVGPIPIWIGATPLGIAQTASAGDSIVNATFNQPVTPAAPATRFSLTWTTDPTRVWELGYGVLSNASLPGIRVWNTTKPYQFLVGQNNATIFLEVRAWNSFGLGSLPAAFTPVAATPRPLVLTPILGLTGGLAPYTVDLSATATAGSNTTLLSVLFTYPGGTVAPVPVEVNGTFYLNVTLIFPSPGSFTVVLHVADAYYDIAIETYPVFVAPGLAPALSAAVANPPSYAGAPVAFQATASGGSGSYLYNWSFGDGSQASGPDPVHVYSISGQYSVVLLCVDLLTGGQNTTVLSVTIYAFPVIFVSVTQGPNGSLSYEFRASVGGGSGNSTVVWTFGDGTVARGGTVTHDYRDVGTYSVNVSATDPAGRAGSTQFNLSAYPTPGAVGPANANGLSLLDTILLVAAAGFGTLTVLLILWRGRPPEGEPVEAEEDGAVSLT